MTKTVSKWGKAFWDNLGERVISTLLQALGGALVVGGTTPLDFTDPRLWYGALLVPTALALIKGLGANLANPTTGPSLLSTPPGSIIPGHEDEGDTPDPAAKADQEPRTLVRVLPRTDPRLGRHVEHDPRSRGFARPTTVDKSTWHTKTIRIYDPTPNPNQAIGNCTGVAKCIQLNAAGDRKRGDILGMADATKIYTVATTLDDITGTYPPDDTGSSGLAAAKAAQKLGLGGAYYWLFGGADEVVQAVMDGDVVNVGTRWDQAMFQPDAHGVVHPGGPVAGGHEWSVRGYDAKRDLVLGRCWWGEFRDFWISRTDLDALLADQGDAHVQARA